MRGNSAQWGKETRQMAWPWAIVMVAGLLVMARPWFASLPDIPGMAGVWNRMVDWILPIGAFFGTAILAVLPLGSEFQYRTLAMHMAQPIDREQIWRQKFLLTVAAVVPPAVIYCIALGSKEGRGMAFMAAAWIIMTMFGAIPFTILARSIIGGMVLNQLGAFWVMMGWSLYEQHKISAAWLRVGWVAVVAYTIFMSWLGRRMILRFQAVDGMQAREDFVPGAQLVPEAVSRWLECRPGQPIANLVRREFRLTRMIWLLIAIYAVAWIFMLIFHLLPDERSGERFIAFAFTVITGVIIAVLAGTLSLGEEKTGGTHDWNLTLPVSPTTQWAIKLLFGVGTSVIGVVLVPIVIVFLGSRPGDPIRQYWAHDQAWTLLLFVLQFAGITLVAFWCACVVKGTIQATLWVFPLAVGVGLAGEAGSWVLEPFQQTLGHWVGIIVLWLNPVAVGRELSRFLDLIGFRNLSSVVIAPLLAVGLIQSLRMFRAQLGANKLRVFRFALPLMVVAFAWGAASVVLFQLLRQTWDQNAAMLRETDQRIGAIMKTSPQAGPRQISVDELSKAAPLSVGTARWLRNATITVTPAPERMWVLGPYIPGRIWATVPTNSVKDRTAYNAILHNARGGDCTMAFQLQRGVAAKYTGGFVTAICE